MPNLTFKRVLASDGKYYDVNFTQVAAPVIVPPPSDPAPTPEPVPVEPTPVEPPATDPIPTSGRPGPANTGYKNAPGYPGKLTPFSGSLVSGTTYSFRSFPGGIDMGTKDSPKSNITFIGCQFKGKGEVLVRLYGDNHTFDYCSFEPAVSVPPVRYSDGYQYGLCGNGGWYTSIKKLTVTNCDMWGFGNGIDCQGSTQAKPHVFRNNWIHDARDDGGIDHTDGLGNMSGGGSSHYVVIDNNVIESVGNTNGIAWQGGSYDHMTITNNLIGGWGYAVSVYSNVTNLTFTDNVFSTRLPCSFGPLREGLAGYPGTVWKRNKWMVPSSAAWGSPAHNGWFWRPVAGSRSSTDDTKFVSQTDV